MCLLRICALTIKMMSKIRLLADLDCWIKIHLLDKFARFLFEFHSVRFESLDLLLLPADRSDFDVHGALEDDKVKTEKHCCVLNIYCYVLYILFHLYALSQLNLLYSDIMLVSLG